MPKRSSAWLAVSLVALSLLVAGCTAAPGSGPGAPELVGEWRVYSQTLFYDAGGHSPSNTQASSRLDLRADGTWSFGSYSGNWHSSPANDADWPAWGIDSYGPQRKIVLDGWSGKTVSGPIEETADRVDFIWVIYRVEPPIVSDPGQMHVKFGRVNP